MHRPVGAIDTKVHPLARIRYQLLGGLLLSVGLPLAILLLNDPAVFHTDNVRVAVPAVTIAHLAGYYTYRRLGIFPGVAATGTILPAFGLSYGVVMAIVLMFRLDYSRFQMIASLFLAVSWYFSVSLLTRRLGPYRLAIIPGGQVDNVLVIDGVRWDILVSPTDPLPEVQGVVVDLRADLSDSWERFIADCALGGTPVYHYKQIVESLSGRIEIEHLSENTLGSLNPNQAYITVKQVLDMAGALVALFLLAPLLVLVAIAIRLDSPGPALFRQKRIGYRGIPFTVYKFRTMRQHDASSPPDERQRAITHSQDARITRIGRVLRRTRIDELPQLINVLRDEMSLIGPRPEVLVLSQWYEAELPFYRYRHIVRPGITGWAQVNQGHVAAVGDVREKLHYDFYYIKNFSPWFDIVITLRTIKTLLTGFGAR